VPGGHVPKPWAGCDGVLHQWCHVKGIEVQHDRQEHLLHLSQNSYIDAILWCFGFEDLKPISILMNTQVTLSTAQSPFSTANFTAMRNLPYCKAVGLLMYLNLTTWPDIAFTVSVISKFALNPGIEHWNAVNMCSSI